MYTGLELAIISYVVGFVIHIAFFRFFEGFYRFIDNFNLITPTCWCFLWPIAWVVFCIYYVARFIEFCYSMINYIVSRQWNFKW
jgi:hypothetical protein